VGLGLARGLGEGFGVGLDEALGEALGDGLGTKTLTWGFSRRHCAHAWMYRS
jgi:hypothetical protein